MRILNLIFHNFRRISPFTLVLLLIILLYVRLYTNDSNEQGIIYFEKGDYQKALQCFNEYLNLHPHDISTLYNRGRCFEELGDSLKAAEDYLHVLEMDAENVKALLSLSQYYYNKKEFNIAINLTTTAANIESGNYLAHYLKARALHKNGDFLEAIDAYNMVIDLNPNFGEVYLHRGNLYLQFGWPPFGCHDLKTASYMQVKGAKEAFQKYCR